ncbi:hypothetical protein BUALT_Bualt07G0029500 [Buddleja alternifolia]|uniref:Uncharacterized protein n=1 Tax=Buddleja alternifolia TaxID=168488 RepID=A0AAV6X7H4_9LAMI|nr:hypothetical protein BUALT_Bualt07G0029500 [Buddleja alternifolia]
MTIIGSLPNLEVLKLSSNAFVGSEWNPIEGEFLRLKFLLLSNIDLVKWRAEHIPFPSLETLELRRMYSLKEIPKSFGEIATLRLIHLVRTYGVRDSAKEILLEQESFGNDGLQVHVTDGKGRTYQL